ncbi:hypothetical protein [Desulfosporosinus metallidurans]|uniref:Lipoprotein n=1 Tax=Desulfosporosinus metallidurans TaxID=1888891 RepID=A0A1Q8QXI1_9FIRM|nr:hypothetical protein [Desulfosporosinus metallidurans]OLN32049.1 hypothetical protein DSOL_2142 [Desulfosporosinus metallidurans]
MRKIIVLTAIIILALVLTGCGNGNIASKSNQPSTNTTQQAGNATNQQLNTNDSSTKAGGAAIVAKSENIMSSSDKEELLNQVNKELDSLFSNINNLEDAQDADLDLNQK